MSVRTGSVVVVVAVGIITIRRTGSRLAMWM